MLSIFIVLDRGEYGFDLKTTDQPQSTVTDDKIGVPRAFVEGAAPGRDGLGGAVSPVTTKP